MVNKIAFSDVSDLWNKQLELSLASLLEILESLSHAAGQRERGEARPLTDAAVERRCAGAQAPIPGPHGNEPPHCAATQPPSKPALWSDVDGPVEARVTLRQQGLGARANEEAPWWG